jgi:tetratricopeptide (TPR) repeat protein
MPVTNIALLLALFGQAGTTAQGIDEFRQGRYAQARADLEKALAAHPDDGAARAFLAITKAAGRDCADAAGEFVSNRDATLARMSGLAAVECYAAAARAEDAFRLLAKVESRFPADPDVLYESARLHRKAWDKAVLALYQSAPSSYRVNQLSAEVFETQGKYGEAAAQYRTAIEKAPNALNLHFRLGRCMLLDSPTPENLDKAREQFEAELKLNPTDAVAEYEIGQVLAAGRKTFDAVAHYERALAMRPDFAEALIAVGKARAESKQYVDAAKLFERAVALDPSNEAARYNLMLAYRNLGRTADALAQKKELDRLQKPPEGEFTEFLKKLGEKAPQP